MFTNFFKNLYSLSNGDAFESVRLRTTYNKDFEAPDNEDLNFLLLVFKGFDP